jgi:uncharacterized protein YkwD
MDSEEQKLLDLTNQYRVANGLGTLQADYLLTRIALWKANDVLQTIIKGGTPAHDDSFRTWDQRFTDCGYTVFLGPDVYRGENLNGGPGDASATLTYFQNSPEHNANLLSPNYIAVGIKRVSAPDPKDKTKLYWVWGMSFGGAVDQDLTTAVSALNSGQDPLAGISPGAATPTASSSSDSSDGADPTDPGN